MGKVIPLFKEERPSKVEIQSSEEIEDRIARIRKSIEKINNLMREVKKGSKKS